MSGSLESRFRRALPAVGTLYLVYLATRPPPVRWMALACLAILVPFLLGWVAGNVFGFGPWAE